LDNKKNKRYRKDEIKKNWKFCFFALDRGVDIHNRFYPLSRGSGAILDKQTRKMARNQGSSVGI